MFTKIAMSKPVGKMLNNKFVKKTMIPVGNKVIKTVKANTPGKIVSRAVKIESNMAKNKDMNNRANAPRGAYGKLPANIKVKK
jgi:hypothetical protein